eukprot:12429167-Karenia_brevis.AAC.1
MWGESCNDSAGVGSSSSKEPLWNFTDEKAEVHIDGMSEFLKVVNGARFQLWSAEQLLDADIALHTLARHAFN